jgi:hypothetical protein
LKFRLKNFSPVLTIPWTLILKILYLKMLLEENKLKKSFEHFWNLVKKIRSVWIIFKLFLEFLLIIFIILLILSFEVCFKVENVKYLRILTSTNKLNSSFYKLIKHSIDSHIPAVVWREQQVTIIMGLFKWCSWCFHY